MSTYLTVGKQVVAFTDVTTWVLSAKLFRHLARKAALDERKSKIGWVQGVPELEAKCNSIFGPENSNELMSGLAAELSELKLAPNEVVLREGDTDNRLYIVTEGRVNSMTKSMYFGVETLLASTDHHPTTVR